MKNKLKKLYERYLRWRLHPASYLVWCALGAADEWELESEHTLKHKPTGVVFWTSNGPVYFDEYYALRGGKQNSIRGRDRYILWKRVRKIRHQLEHPSTDDPIRRLFVRMTQLVDNENSVAR